jgi:hypothetical protein
MQLRRYEQLGHNHRSTRQSARGYARLVYAIFGMGVDFQVQSRLTPWMNRPKPRFTKILWS